MQSIQQIKSRLGAVKNIGTITRAMEVVSATKMRKAQTLAFDSRPYAYAALATLADLLTYASSTHLENSVFVSRSPVSRMPGHRVSSSTLLVLVASDRGLAGSFNANVMRVTDAYITNNPGNYKLILVGKKLAAWATRNRLLVEMVFSDFGDYAEAGEITPLTDLISQGFLMGKWQKVAVISTHFKTTLNLMTVIRELLPMHIDQIRETVREIVPESGKYSELRDQMLRPAVAPPSLRQGYAGGAGGGTTSRSEFLFEPTPVAVLDSILQHLLNMQLFHLVLEANASEHSARMVAMKNASENASELSSDLSLEFNKARQAAITKEMIEISSALQPAGKQ